MSLYDMDTDTTDALSTVALGNSAMSYLISSLQAADWEPDGFIQGVQTFRKGQRRIGVVVVEVPEAQR